MISLKLIEIKAFMAKLLLADSFDSFLFIEGDITTYNTFSIDGFLKKEFFDNPHALGDRSYALWKDTKDFCMSIIKGKRTPLAFKFVFALPKSDITLLLKETHLSISLEEIQGLYLNFKYDQGVLYCVSGSSMHTFSMDKSLDHAWDSKIQTFFKQQQIIFELL